MTSLDRTPGGTASPERAYVWATVVTTVATLATILILALTGNDEAAIALAAAGLLSGVVFKVTVHVRR